MDPREHCISLLKVIKARELAHIEVRDWNKRLDKFFKVGALLSSTATTYAVNVQEEEVDYTTLLMERTLAFSTTVLSGLNVLLNNSCKAEKHAITAKKCSKLANILEVKINSDNCTQADLDHFNHLYREDILKDALALHSWVIKRHPLVRGSQVTELQHLDSL